MLRWLARRCPPFICSLRAHTVGYVGCDTAVSALPVNGTILVSGVGIPAPTAYLSLVPLLFLFGDSSSGTSSTCRGSGRIRRGRTTGRTENTQSARLPLLPGTWGCPRKRCSGSMRSPVESSSFGCSAVPRQTLQRPRPSQRAVRPGSYECTWHSEGAGSGFCGGDGALQGQRARVGHLRLLRLPRPRDGREISPFCECLNMFCARFCFVCFQVDDAAASGKCNACATSANCGHTPLCT